MELETELKARAEINFQGFVYESMNNKLCGKIVEDVRKMKKKVTALAAKECVEMPSKIRYGNYKQNETEGGDPVTI